jgi:hypothetical protein
MNIVSLFFSSLGEDLCNTF